MNCLIIDDEPLAQNILESHVSASKELQLIKKCNTAIEAFELLHLHHIDLLFLDVKMPGLNGVDFIKSLKNPPAVIFTTAFSEYAAISYELEAIDYLIKPITVERFNKSLEKLFKRKPKIIEEKPNYAYFKVSGKLIKVAHSSILYAQSIKDYLMLYTTNGNLIVHMTMKYLSELLPEDTFIRIHRSYIVNQYAIGSIGKSQIEIGEVQIPIGESYKEVLNQLRGKLT
ncbi:MAG: response regulator transcription factor [Chitinophagaceae bacterium]|nr:MAG: response regulator transcription factor [Chitinophagaceae bacterium]